MSSADHPDILVMKDPFDSYKVKKRYVFDLPFRALVIGKSQFAGKTNVLTNFLMRPMDADDEGGHDFYRDDFSGDNIYIFGPLVKTDNKWLKMIEYKEIPKANIYTEYSEAALLAVYDELEKRYTKAVNAKKKPEHSLVILDDCSFGGALKSKMHGAIAKLFCNGRHFLISTMITSQKYTDILTTCRENYTGMCIFECSSKQLDLIYEDVGMSDKKDFVKMFRETTKEPHSFMVVNAKCVPEERFQDMHFQPLTSNKEHSG